MSVVLALAIAATAVQQSESAMPPADPAAALVRLPEPTHDPLAIDFAVDPVLRFGRETAPVDDFRATIARAVGVHPEVRAAAANVRVASAVRGEAQTALFPTADLNIEHNRSLDRGFSNDPQSVLERIQPTSRTDASATVSQTFFDFGATTARIRAATARRDAAEADLMSSAETVALRAVSAWYDLAAYRTLAVLNVSLIRSLDDLREAVALQAKQGYAAEGDLARIDVSIGNAQARTATLAGSLAGAEARYEEAIGQPPPAALRRPEIAAPVVTSVEMAKAASDDTPQVSAARAAERAARADYRAAHADNLPVVRGVLDAGRFGVFENDRDYDIRGRLALNVRIGGAGYARTRQASARLSAAQADRERVQLATERDAAVAYGSLDGANRQVVALEGAYSAARRSRDVLAERFRVTRGTLLDLMTAEDTYFQIALTYVQAVVQRDAQKLVLLQREGHLLDFFGIAPKATTR